MTHSSPSRTARVLMPATSEPASGSVMPRQRIFSPLIAGTSHSCFCSSVPNSEDRRHGHVGLDRDAHRQAAGVRVAISSPRTSARSSRRPAPPYSSGLSRPRKPSSPMRGKTESGKVVSSHSSACGASSLRTKRADRLPELLVLIGEDEVLAARAEVGLEDVGRGRCRWPAAKSKQGLPISTCDMATGDCRPWHPQVRRASAHQLGARVGAGHALEAEAPVERVAWRRPARRRSRPTWSASSRWRWRGCPRAGRDRATAMVGLERGRGDVVAPSA